MRVLLVALTFVLLSTPLPAKPTEYFLLHGNCKLPLDPNNDIDRIRSAVFTCSKGTATIDGVFIPNQTVGLAERFDFHTSIHYGLTHALFFETYFEQIASHVKDELPYSRDEEIQTLAYQFGNPATDRFRAIVGQQRPAFGINQFPNIALNQILDPRYIWGLSDPGINLIYDNQKEAQVEFQCTVEQDYRYLSNHLRGQVSDYSMSSRFMYDFSVLGGTRAAFSILAKKSGEKRLGFGLISIGPNQNRFQAEWVRIYASLSNSLISAVTGTLANSTEGLNSPYQQLVRFAYEDPPGQAVQNIFLFDDVAFQYRLFAYGATLNFFSSWSFLRFLIAYKQDQTGSDRHRWILSLGVGGRL